MVEDSRTTVRKYQDRLLMDGSTTGSRAVAPAGGCVVLVNCIATIAVAVDSEAASHASWCGLASVSCARSLRLKILVNTMPIKALMKWPPMTARG